MTTIGTIAGELSIVLAMLLGISVLGTAFPRGR